MQTFMPYPDFRLTAQCLDNKRLGKQRVEAFQIYLALTQSGYGWRHHPIVKMWKGYEHALLFYGLVISDEWRQRGYKDVMFERFQSLIPSEYLFESVERLKMPTWIGNEEFHRSHQSNLVRKDSEYYRRFFPDVPDNLPYVWIK